MPKLPRIFGKVSPEFAQIGDVGDRQDVSDVGSIFPSFLLTICGNEREDDDLPEVEQEVVVDAARERHGPSALIGLGTEQEGSGDCFGLELRFRPTFPGSLRSVPRPSTLPRRDHCSPAV